MNLLGILIIFVIITLILAVLFISFWEIFSYYRFLIINWIFNRQSYNDKKYRQEHEKEQAWDNLLFFLKFIVVAIVVYILYTLSDIKI